MTHRATGIGSMPGDLFDETTQTVLGELVEPTGLAFLVELPDRGPHATMVGRTAAMLTELGVDLQPAGWRLTDASGLDHRRAVSLLAHDLDVVEELGQGELRRFKVQAAGPWTLAASMERPRGDRVLGDHGARRDLAQALAEGLLAHANDVRRRVGGAALTVQIDEPALPAVLAGAVPTASGFSRHRSVAAPEAAQAIEWLVSALAADGFETVVHCCAGDLPLGVLAETSVHAFSFDLAAATSADFDDLATWVDGGRALWPGAVPSVDPPGQPPTAADVTTRLISWWSDLGHADVESIPDTTVTPACGLAGATPAWARTALKTVRDTARNLSVEAGKMDP